MILYKDIIDYLITGHTQAETAEFYNTSVKNIQRILSTDKGKEYKKTKEFEINSRKNKTNSERIQTMILRLIESAESKFDTLTDNDARLSMVDTVLSLTKLVTMPEDVPVTGDIPIAYIPETRSIESFNRDTLEDKKPEKITRKSAEPVLTPGGSEIPAPEQNSEKEKEGPSYDEIDEEFMDEDR